MSAAALSHAVPQSQEDPHVISEVLSQQQEILKVAAILDVNLRCFITCLYGFYWRCCFHTVADLPTCMVLRPLPKRQCDLGWQLASILLPFCYPLFLFSLPPQKNENQPEKKCKLEKNLDGISLLLSLYGTGYYILRRCCCLCAFSLVSVDIFNSCFSYPFRGSLKTFVHTVHLLQKQTDLGTLPVADVLYRSVVTFLIVALLPRLW